MDGKLRILFIEDSEDDALLLKRHLGKAGLDIVSARVDTLPELGEALDKKWDVIICDYKMPKFSALQALDLIQKKGVDVPFIIVSGTVGEDIATDMMARGASDYVMKDNLTRLASSITRELREYKERQKRKIVEYAMVTSEARFRGIAENSIDVIYSMNMDGTLTYVSPSAEKTFGYKAENMAGTSFYDYLIGPDAPMVIKEFEAAVRNSSLVEGLQCMAKKQDGSGISIEVNSSPVFGSGGKAIGFQGIIRDITSRKNSEARLKKLNETFLNFTDDPDQNINLLIALCGEILGATCAMYNRLEGDLLCSCGVWNPPANFIFKDKAEGHICFDVIMEESDDIFVIQDLDNTKYSITDPNVSRYGLKTYMGRAVKVGGRFVGSLCVVYQKDFSPDESDSGFFEIVSSAIAIEEERKISQDKLSDQRLFLQQLIDSMPAPIFYKNMNGAYMGCNVAFEKLAKINRDKIIGKVLGEIAAEKIAKKQALIDAELMAHPGVKAYEFEVISADGEMVSFIMNKATYFDIKGAPAGIVGIMLDVTRLRKAEIEIRQSRDFLTGILNTLADPVFVKDEKHRMVIVNDAEVALIGWPKGSVVGKDDYEFFPKDEVKVFWEKDDAVIKTGIINENEESITDSSGITRVILTKKARYVDPATGEKYLVGAIRDITDRKKAEESLRKAYEDLKDAQLQLIQAEKLQTVGTLASGIAHEVKNPLGIILMAVNYLEKELPRKKKKEQEALRAIKDAITRANKIVCGLLSFSRQSAYEFKKCDFKDIVETSLDLLQKQMKLKKVIIKKDFAKGKYAVFVDELQIEQCILNVAINAIQAMPNGGDLIFKLYKSSVKDLRGRNMLGPEFRSSTDRAVVCEIIDTGIGMSKEVLIKIFDPFFTTKAPSKGVGLGLSITKTIVDANHGAITVNSEEGKGTNVMIVLPCV